MKRKDLIREVERKGFYFYRSGANHDIYTNGKKKIAIPRHNEIHEATVRAIFKEMGE